MKFPVLVVVIPLMVSFLIPVAGFVWQRSVHYLAILALLGVSACSFYILWMVKQSGTISYHLGGWAPPFGIEYRIDLLNALLLPMVSVIALVVLVHGKALVDKEIRHSNLYYAIFLLFVTGLLGILVTGDLFNLFVFLEIASLCAYSLVCLSGGRSYYAAFKYLILGTIGACFYLLGVGYIYIKTGSLNMVDVAGLIRANPDSILLMTSLIFLIAGLSVKMALFPFHVWMPDAYAYSPQMSANIMAPLMTKVAAYGMIRIIVSVFGVDYAFFNHFASHMLALAGAGAIIFGSVLAILQTDYRRMLAYSSVSQLGVIALGVGISTPLAITGSILHIINHAFMKGSLFLVSSAIFLKSGSNNVRRFDGLSKSMPLTSLIFVISALSIVGVPPFPGFFSKWYLVLGSLNGPTSIYAVVILVGSLLSAVYMFGLIRKAYFLQGRGEKREAPVSMLAPGVFMALSIVALGIFNFYLVSAFIDPFVKSAMAGP